MVRLEKIVLHGFKSFKRPVSLPFPTNFVVVTGPNGSGKCVTGDTLVHLSDGKICRIDKLVEGEIKKGKTEKIDDGYICKGKGDVKICCLDTRTLKSRIAPVSAFVKRKSPKNLTKIRTRLGREITATDYHPLFVMRGDRIESSKAGELKEGMKIAVPRVVNTETTSKDFLELTDMITEGDALYAPWCKEYSDILRDLKKTTWKALAEEIGIPEMHIKCVLAKQSVNMASVIKILKHANKGFKDIAKLIPDAKSKAGNVKCRIPWKNSKGFSRFLGYVIAEGRITSSNQVWFTNGDDEIVEDYRRLVESLFGLKASVNEYKPSCWDVLVYSRALQRILMKFGVSEGKTKEKKITNLFLSHSGKEEISEFLNGIYSSDGYVLDRSIEITTGSRNLSLSIGYMLSRLGIRFSSKKVIKIATNTGYSGEYWTLTSYGSENARKFSENINLIHRDKRERVIEISNKEPNPNIDLIPVNSLVRDVVREFGISVKRLKKRFPRLDSYCYDQCTPSVYGINHLIENLFCPQVSKSNSIPDSLTVLSMISQSDIFWDEIIEIEKIESPSDWVYDLSVDVHHNFVANGLFVHNSNVADSIAFVLGKSSSKYLRAKKAQDLIFHGSKKKPGSDFAKVNLFLSNKEKVLPMDEETVSVTRKLNKEGVSTYRLNGKVTPKQQILDMFIQARLNPGGHNMIRQGDVTKIIEMNPVERREIIDEISGILEYDEKKMQALKELEKVEVKVREAEIVLEQKEEIIDKLKNDRDAAMEHVKLNKELELVRSTIVWKEFSSTERNLGNIDEQVSEKEKESKRLGEDVKKVDREMKQKENELEKLMEDVFKVSDQLELNKKISHLESSIEGKRNKILMNEREMVRLTKMIENLTMMEKETRPGMEKVLEFDGVHGVVSDLVVVSDQYRIAVDVAGGSHLRDIVVDTTGVAVKCVKYLKEKRIGRARFLPLDRLKVRRKQSLPQGTLGWLSELVHHDRQYVPVIEYVFGNTACVHDIDKAKRIGEKNRIRMVTLDGDLLETSGAITGGYYIKSGVPPEVKSYKKEKGKLSEENSILKLEIEELEEKLGNLNKKVKKFEGDKLERERKRLSEEIEKLREKRKGVYEERAIIQNDINRLKINRAKYEANFDNLKPKWEELKKEWEKFENREFFQKRGLQALKEREREILESIGQMGPVNLKAIDEFEVLRYEFEEFRERVEKIASEKDSIVSSITEIENRKRETFTKTMDEMAKLFKEIYAELTQGEAELGLEDPNDINSGLLISASPPGKKLLYIDSMSGGEKVLTALAFLFTIQRYKPSPIYVWDEVDAALDKPNTKRVVDLIKKHSKDLQFIIISHNNELIKEADQVYGVSMEDGESKIIGIELPGEN